MHQKNKTREDQTALFPTFQKTQQFFPSAVPDLHVTGSWTASNPSTSKRMASLNCDNSLCVTPTLPSKSFKLKEITHKTNKMLESIRALKIMSSLFNVFLCFKSNRSQLGKILALLSHLLPI